MSSAVLVFDPDPSSATGLTDLLALVGRRSTRAESADDVLATLRTRLVPLILLAVGPDRLAIELLQRIRAQERGQDRRPTAAIAITDLADEQHRLACLLAGFAECLCRPVPHAALAEAVAAVPGRGDRDENGFSPSAIETIALQLDRHLDSLLAETAAADATGVAEATRQTLAICDILGARHLSHVARRIDEAATAGDWDRIGGLADQARSAHEAVIGLLFESMSG